MNTNAAHTTALRSALYKAGGFFVGAVLASCALFVYFTMTMTAPSAPSLAEQDNLGRPDAAGTAMGIAAANDCWVGDAPADMQGVVPGHVVVKVGAGEWKLGGERMVGLALEQLFDGASHNLEIHAFCR